MAGERIFRCAVILGNVRNSNNAMQQPTVLEMASLTRRKFDLMHVIDPVR